MKKLAGTFDKLLASLGPVSASSSRVEVGEQSQQHATKRARFAVAAPRHPRGVEGRGDGIHGLDQALVQRRARASIGEQHGRANPVGCLLGLDRRCSVPFVRSPPPEPDN